MNIIADLHIHSKYARACSKLLSPENLDLWARKKGIGLLGTGDFTHPGWMQELEDKLEESTPGLYRVKDTVAAVHEFQSPRQPVEFMFTTELASIYKQGDKLRRVHNLVFAPNMLAARRFSLALEKRGANLKSDGRPIMGIHCDELVKIAKAVDEAFEVIPAHAWTPHFGVFGSLSGFNSLEEAFGDMAQYIFAIETGLSSDPKMNWQVESLDAISLISNSDPHSLHRLGREANVFELDNTQISYAEVIRVIRQKNPKEFLSTIEFFPEEGRYHLDGHADCTFSCEPDETERRKGICPVCGKKLLHGVLHRVNDLATKQRKGVTAGKVPFKSQVSLEEIIAETYGVGVASKKVQQTYEQLVTITPEFQLLQELPEQELIHLTGKEIATNILKVQKGKVNIIPGYDGLYGKVSIQEAAVSHRSRKAMQNVLF